MKCPKCTAETQQVGKFWICPEHGQSAAVDGSPEKKQEPAAQHPASPMRIFLSYGHDDNEDLVRQIKADLEQRGHDVWFDKSGIKGSSIVPGDDWRRAITEGIINSHKVMSFLSKHSTRDPGVCLDEIAIAIGVKGGNIQTILVESETEVEAPPSIGHIQWLDMHDWREYHKQGGAAWKTWYDKRFAEIVRVVESDESRRFAGEIETLKELLNPVLSDARVAELLGRPFTGRGWVMEKLRKWREKRGSASRLFWIMGYPGVGKSAFAAHISHYAKDLVIAVHFCEWNKRDHLDALQVVRTLAFQLATRLPDYRKFLLGLPGLAALETKSPAELFDYLLAYPLLHVIDGARADALVVIDGLDEANENGRNPLAEVIAEHASRLPAWLGILITSRPEREVQAPLLGLKGMRPMVLKGRQEDNLKDIRDYLNKELEKELAERDGPALIEAIIEKSEGVFLYVEQVCEEIRSENLSLDRLEDFPLGLSGIYAQYFRRQFPDLGAYEATTRHVLGVMAVAREPLEPRFIANLFSWDEYKRSDFFASLGALFSQTDGRARAFHKSLFDWLTGINDAGNPAAGVYHVSREAGHRLLAEAGWAAGSREDETLHAYFVRHLPGHLLATEDWHKLITILGAPSLIEARKDTDPTGRWMAQDYADALTVLPPAFVNRLWAVSEACPLLVMEGVRELADRGNYEKIKLVLPHIAPLVSGENTAPLACLWHVLDGRLAIYQGDYERAETGFLKGCQLAREQGYVEGEMRALLGLGVLLRVSGRSNAEAEDILRSTLDLPAGDTTPEVRARVQLNLAAALTSLHRPEEATDCLDDAQSLISQNETGLLRATYEKYRGYLLLSQQQHSPAAEAFHAAWNVFESAGNVAESRRCQLLSQFAAAGIRYTGDALIDEWQELVQHLAAQAPSNAHIQQRAGRIIETLTGLKYSLQSSAKGDATMNAAAVAKAMYALMVDLQGISDPTPLAAAPHQHAGECRIFANIEFVWCPPGTFIIGSPEHEKERDGSEGPQRLVKIDQGFWLGKYPVTQAQWEQVMGNNPSRLKGTQNPVEGVSWCDTQAFIQNLNMQETGTFRLPTETEWEYACRAGTTTRFYWGDDPNETQIEDYAWYWGNSGFRTHPVGQKYPNPWGLYDMSGNVWEWCEDNWHDNYIGAPTDGRAWVDLPRSSFRVVRGGCWGNYPGGCRSAIRGRGTPGIRNYALGFRLAWPAVQ